MLSVYGITYDHTTNYGSCFQAYALQCAIENLVIQGEHPSYFLIPFATFKDLHVTDSGKNIGFLIYIKRKIHKLLFLIQRKKFVPFEKRFMKYAICNRLADLSLLNEKADAFVCGSDVIWRFDFNGRRGEYFLDFATKFKFSYAASFGIAEINKEDCAYVRDKLASFNSISVREKTSLQIAKKCTDKDVQIVADPVVLLDPEEWKKVMDKPFIDYKYIFVYTTHLNNTFKKFLETLKTLTGLQVIVAEWNRRATNAIKEGMISVQSPEKWLSLLQQAEYVVTNSFHATVFSVLFHKKFFTVVHGDKARGINMRMNDFLNAVHLDDRIFSSVPDTIDLSEIDYTTADEKIASMRTESLSYLRKNLEAAYKQKNPVN